MRAKTTLTTLALTASLTLGACSNASENPPQFNKIHLKEGTVSEAYRDCFNDLAILPTVEGIRYALSTGTIPPQNYWARELVPGGNPMDDFIYVMVNSEGNVVESDLSRDKAAYLCIPLISNHTTQAKNHYPEA